MGTTAQKLTYLNDTKTQLKDTINYSGASITDDTFRQYPRKLYTQYLDILKDTSTLFSGMPKVPQQTGTELTLDNTADTKMKLELNPSELTQETTTGKNLLPNNLTTIKTYNTLGTWSNNVYTYNGLTFTFNDDGTFKINGTSTGNAYVNLYLSTSGNLISDTTKTYTFTKGITNTNIIEAINEMINSAWTPIKYTFADSTTYTPSGNSTGQIFRILIETGKTISNVIVYPMIVEGTTVGAYEPYTGGIPQPNPNYPSEVQVIKGNNSILIRSKNLFDKNDITSSNGYISDANGNFVSNSSQPTKASNYIYVKGINKLHFSTNMTTNRWGAFYDENKTFISGFNFSQTNPLTVPANAYYMRTTVQTSILDEFQVEIGESGTDYVAHQEQVLPLNLPVENLFDYSAFTSLLIGVTETSHDINEFVIGGTTAWSSYTLIAENNKKNEDYTLNFNVLSGLARTSGISVYGSSTNDGSNLTSLNAFTTSITANTKTNVSLTFNSGNYDYTVFRFWNNYSSNALGSKVDLYFTEIMLEKGTQADQYTPYGTTPIEYCKIGTYEDEFEHDGDKWYINKAIGKVVLDGSENVSREDTSTSGNYRFDILSSVAFKYGNASYVGEMLCNKLLPTSRNGTYLSQQGIAPFNSSGNFYCQVYIEATKTLSIVDFKTWLSNNHLTVYGVLQTPTHTEITDTTLINQLNAIEQAVSYDEQTNISQINTGLPFRIKATAIKRTESVFV